jgi:hypothetical protein
MQSHSLVNGLRSGLSVHSGERRKNTRFDMHFPVFLRGRGDPWSVSETADVSATGAFFVTDHPFLLNNSIEYVLTFPPDLTKAPQPLRVRFFGVVLRCEQVPGSQGVFGIAVRKTAHRYLTREEGTSFDTMEEKHSPGASPTAASQPLKTVT